MSDLLKCLNDWKKKPSQDLSDMLFDKVPDKKIKTVEEAAFICDCIGLLKSQLEEGFDETLATNIDEIASLFQYVETDETIDYFRENGILPLTELLDIMLEKDYSIDSYINPKIQIVRMVASYSNKEAYYKLISYIKKGVGSDDYSWESIFRGMMQNDSKYTFVIKELGGFIPEDFIGITYLDMCNNLNIQSADFIHPFNNEEGVNYLKNIIQNYSEDTESYVVSATVSIPFLNENYRTSIIEEVNKLEAVSVKMEAAWACARLGMESAIEQLITFARDHRYSRQAVSYMRELDLSDRIPSIVEENDFAALSEMCSWLNHPNEFGKVPDQIEVFSKKQLYWEATKDTRLMYALKYTYKNYQNSGKDEIGIGMVGSVTFALFDYSELLEMIPIEVFGTYCLWEMNKEYKDKKQAKKIIEKKNKKVKW